MESYLIHISKTFFFLKINNNNNKIYLVFYVVIKLHLERFELG